MAKEHAEENESTLLPRSDEDREDSGLQDILAVAAKLKDKEAEDFGEGEDQEPGDSGLIVFTAGDLDGGSEAAEDDDEALFGSFAGGLGLTAVSDSQASADLTPLGGEGSVSEGQAAEVTPKPAEEPKRNPLTAIAVVLGLGLVAAGAVYLTDKGGENQPQEQAHAEMSAAQDEAAVGKAEEPEAGPEAGASAGGGPGEAVEPEPEVESAGEVDSDGALLGGETEGALLADADAHTDDPMAQKDGLLEGGSNPVAKAGKWDQGKSSAKPAGGGESDSAAADPQPDPQPDPEPDPIAAPEPQPDPKPAGGGGNDDEVDCLLNPDLPKCQSGGGGTQKKDEVLAPKLPEKLDSKALRDGFNKIKSKAKSCGSKHGAAAGTKVKVHVSIEGATGKVTAVEATGEHAGTELGKCVEGVVKGASFEQFKKPAMGIDYSLIM